MNKPGNPDNHIEIIFNKLVDMDTKTALQKLNSLLNQNKISKNESELLLELLSIDQNITSIDNPLPNLESEAIKDISLQFSDPEFNQFTIVRKIASGGMGSVYLAERNDGVFDHEVAIKISHIHISNTQQQKFITERQVLAKLNHPNIARIIDGGKNSAGQPYLVMEYIKGLPIDQYCQKHKPSLKKRIQLIIDTCKAVAYAHRKLVLHRDLKPDNILVTDEGEVKLLDFGIAKLLKEDNDKAMPTKVMTRRYASPEQIKGEPLGTQSDQFSMAIIAFELLTGFHPFPAPKEFIREQNVLSETFNKIDTFSNSQNATYPELCLKNIESFKGDLEHILLKALSAEPDKRYDTVNAFIQDFQNYLSKRPVIARKPSSSYFIYKWIQRHKAIFALSLITIFTLIGATFYSLQKANLAFEQKKIAESQKSKAELEAEKAQQVADFLKTLFIKANPEKSKEQLSAQDILMQGFIEIDNKQFTSQKTKFEIISLIHDSLNSLGKLNESENVIDQQYHDCIRSLGEQEPICQELLLHKASIEIIAREDVKALQTMKKAEAISNQYQNLTREQLHTIYEKIMISLYNLNRYDEAAVYGEKSYQLEVEAPVPNVRRLAEIKNGLAIGHILNKKFDKSKENIDQMYSYFEKLPKEEHDEFLINYYNLLAFHYFKQNNAEQSFIYRLKTVSYIKSNFQLLPQRYGRALISAAKAAVRAGNAAHAMSLFDEAENFFNENISDNQIYDFQIALHKSMLLFLTNQPNLAAERILSTEKINEKTKQLVKTDEAFYRIAEALISTQSTSIKKLEQTITNISDVHGELIKTSEALTIYFKILRVNLEKKKKDAVKSRELLSEVQAIVKQYPDDYKTIKSYLTTLQEELHHIEI